MEGAACGGDGVVPGEQSCSATEVQEKERALDGPCTAVGLGRQPCMAARLQGDSTCGGSAHSFAALILGRASRWSRPRTLSTGPGTGLECWWRLTPHCVL